MKNNMRAIPPAAADMPVNPNTPATIETMKKMSAHLSICVPHTYVRPPELIQSARNYWIDRAALWEGIRKRLECSRGFFISGRRTGGILSLRKKNRGRETREKNKSRIAV